VRALRAPAENDGDAKTRVIAELRTVFTEERTERIKVLLDELQARIDPAAVRIVQRHLDSWRERVELCLPENGKVVADTLEPSQTGLEPLRRQALIWRQLLSGDKEPEAYMDRGERTRLRGALARRIWEDYRRRHWKRVLLVACGVAVAAVFFVWLVSWYDDHKALATVIVGFVGSVAGAVGLSTASVTAALRKSVTTWSELMWNTTLTDVICAETISVGELLPAPDELAQGNRSQLANAVTHGRFHVRRAPEPQP
jgi:hypothetical protein